MNNAKKLVAYAVALALASGAKTVSAEVVNNTTLDNELKKASVFSNFGNTNDKDLKETYSDYRTYLENRSEDELIVWTSLNVNQSNNFLDNVFVSLNIYDSDSYYSCNNVDFDNSYILCYPKGSLVKGSQISLSGMNFENEYGKQNLIKPIDILSHLEQFTWYSEYLVYEVHLFDINGKEYTKSQEVNFIQDDGYGGTSVVNLGMTLDIDNPNKKVYYSGQHGATRYYTDSESDVIITYTSGIDVSKKDVYPSVSKFSIQDFNYSNSCNFYVSDGSVDLFNSGDYNSTEENFYNLVQNSDGYDKDTFYEFETFDKQVGPYNFKCSKVTVRFKTKSLPSSNSDGLSIYMCSGYDNGDYILYGTMPYSNTIYIDNANPKSNELNSSPYSVCQLDGNFLEIRTNIQDMFSEDQNSSYGYSASVSQDGVWLEIYDKDNPSDKKVIVPEHKDWSNNYGQEIYRTEVNDKIDLTKYFEDFENFNGTLVVELHSKDMIGNEGLACSSVELLKEGNIEVESASINSYDYLSDDSLSYWFTGSGENVKLSVLSKNTSIDANGVYPNKNKFSLVNGSSVYSILVNEDGTIDKDYLFDSHFEVINSEVKKREEFVDGKYVYYLETELELKPLVTSYYDFYSYSLSENVNADFIGSDSGLDVKLDSTAPSKTGVPYFGILNGKLSIRANFYDSGVGVDPNSIKIKVYNNSTGDLLSEHDVVSKLKEEGSSTHIVDTVIEDSNLANYTCKVELYASDLLGNESKIYTYVDSNNSTALKITSSGTGGYEYSLNSNYYDRVYTSDSLAEDNPSILNFTVESKFNNSLASLTNPAGNEIILRDKDTNEQYSIFVDQYGSVRYSDNFLDAFSAKFGEDSNEFSSSVLGKGTSSSISGVTYRNLKTQIYLQPKLSGKTYEKTIKVYAEYGGNIVSYKTTYTDLVYTDGEVPVSTGTLDISLNSNHALTVVQNGVSDAISGIGSSYVKVYSKEDPSKTFTWNCYQRGRDSYGTTNSFMSYLPYTFGEFVAEFYVVDKVGNAILSSTGEFVREIPDCTIDEVSFSKVTLRDNDNDGEIDTGWFDNTPDLPNGGQINVKSSIDSSLSLNNPGVTAFEFVDKDGYKLISYVSHSIVNKYYNPDGSEYTGDISRFPKLSVMVLTYGKNGDGSRNVKDLKVSVSNSTLGLVEKFDLNIYQLIDNNATDLNNVSDSYEYEYKAGFDTVEPIFLETPVVTEEGDKVRIRFKVYDEDSGIDPDGLRILPSTSTWNRILTPPYSFNHKLPCTIEKDDRGRDIAVVDYTFDVKDYLPSFDSSKDIFAFSLLPYDVSTNMYFYYNHNGGAFYNTNYIKSEFVSVDGYDYRDGNDYWINPNNGTIVDIVNKGLSYIDVNDADYLNKVYSNSIILFDKDSDDYAKIKVDREGNSSYESNSKFITSIIDSDRLSSSIEEIDGIENPIDSYYSEKDHYNLVSKLSFALNSIDRDYSISTFSSNKYLYGYTGEHTLDITSSYVKSDITLRTDGTAPSTTGELNLSVSENGLTVTQPEVTDSRSGLKEVYAYVYPSNSDDKGEKVLLEKVDESDDYSINVDLTELYSFGNYTVEVYAEDNVGNSDLMNSKEIFIEQTSPSIEGLTVKGSYEDEERVWVNKEDKASIKFNSSLVTEDGRSVDGSNIYLNDEHSISIDGEGLSSIINPSVSDVNSSIETSTEDVEGGKISNTKTNLEFGLKDSGVDYKLSLESVNGAYTSDRVEFDKLISMDLKSPSIQGTLDTYLTKNNLELYVDLIVNDYADDADSVEGSGVKSVQAKLYKKGETSDEFIDLAFNETKGKFVVEDSVNLAEKFGNYKGEVVLEVYATDNVDNTDVVANTEFALDLSSYVSTGDHSITSYDYKEPNKYWLSSNNETESKGFGIKVVGSSLAKIGTPSYNEISFKDVNSGKVYTAIVNSDGSIVVDEEFKSVLNPSTTAGVSETQKVVNDLTYNELSTELIVNPSIDTEFEVSYKTVVSDLTEETELIEGSTINVTDKVVTDGVSPSSQTAPIVEVVDGKLNIRQFNITDDGSGLDNSSVTCYVYPKNNVDKGQAINMSLNDSSFDASMDVFNHLKGYAGSVIIEIIASDNVGNTGLVSDKFEFLVMPETPINSGVTVEHDGYETLDKIWLRDGNSITVNQSGNSKNTFITDSSIIINGSKADVNAEARLNGSITDSGFTPSIDKNMFKIVDTSFNSESVGSTKKTSASLKLEVNSSDLGVVNDDLYVWGSSRIIVDDLMSASEWSNFAKPIGIDNEAPETISKLRLEKVNNATLIISQRNIEDGKSGLDASSVYAEMYEVNNPSKKIKIALPKSDTGAFYKEVDLMASGNLTGDIVVDIIASDNLGNSGVVSSGTFYRDLDSISNVDSSLTGSVYEDDNAHWINVGDNELTLDGSLSSTNNPVGGVTVVITTNKDSALGDGTIAKIEIDENGSILEDLAGKVTIDESGKLVSVDNGDSTFDNSFGLDFVIDGSIDADEIYIWVSAGSDNVNTGFDRYEKPIKLDKENPNIEADLVSRDKVTIETSDLGSGVDKVIVEYIDGSQKELNDKVLQLDPNISKVTVVDNVGNKNSIELNKFITSIDAKIVPEIIKNDNGFKSLKITATAQLNRNVDTINATFRLRGIGEGIEFTEGDVVATSKNSLSHTLTLVDVDKDKDVSSVEVVEMENNIKRLVVTYSDDTYNDYYFCIESQYDFETVWTLEAEDFQSFVTVIPPVDEEPVPPVEDPDDGDSVAPDIPDIDEPSIPDSGEEETPSIPDDGEELPTPVPPTDDEEPIIPPVDEEPVIPNPPVDEEPPVEEDPVVPIPPVEDEGDEETPTPVPPTDDGEEEIPPTDDDEELPNPPVEDDSDEELPNPPVEDDSDKDDSDNVEDDSDNEDSDVGVEDSDKEDSDKEDSNKEDSNSDTSNEVNYNEGDSNDSNNAFDQEDDISDLENITNDRLPQTGSNGSLLSLLLANLSVISGGLLSRKKKNK